MINAYVDSDAMNSFLESQSEAIVSDKQDINVEVIDAAPLTAEVVYDNDNAEISVYVRDIMHTNSQMIAHGTFKADKLKIDDGEEETVMIAFAVAEGVNKLLYEKGMLDECISLDSTYQGVLFELLNSGEVRAKIVEGKNRPSLLCTSLFGAPDMARPYTDEIMEQFVYDGMSLEEREEAADNGDLNAIEGLATAYLNGDDDVEADPEKAYYWFVKAAEAGNAGAMYNVGLFTAKGYGTERDFIKAAEWMQRAADAGDEDAQESADEYRKLADAVEKARKGDAQAQADLAGGLMKLGKSLDQAGEGDDFKESVMWAEKAVEQGNAYGYWNLALAYYHGRGVEEDIDKAIELYKKGAEAGSAECRYNLGCEYLEGENLKKNNRKGFELVKASAEQGYGLAMQELGRCYQFAIGTAGNMKTAVEWYEKSLDVLYDPEIERKVEAFKELAEIDPNYGEDYPEQDEEYDPREAVSECKEIISAVSQLDEYEEELKKNGILPDVDAGYLEFPRVELKAKEGDKRAIELLKQFEDINENDDEKENADDIYYSDLVPEAVVNVWKYEDELDSEGVLPDEPHGEIAWGKLPRVNMKAEEGNERAIKLIKELDELI